MTSKDYVTIARVLRDTGILAPEPDQINEDRNSLAQAFADELVKENPRFNRDKFLRACGVES